MVFSGGGPALLWVKAVITKQSPEVTAFTLPLNHWFSLAATDAMLFYFFLLAKTCTRDSGQNTTKQKSHVTLTTIKKSS
ncbi:hypothetical protein F2Q68_00004229 [Brassica cretica]|uniref:Uncharacterized protein n=2 Tax=Brassica cretica TaxID=69181 RepID=A0A8S9JDX2_BRACR|nr:hypothetical protein F2Q68_00004229 [Brassica cretica]KAF3551744.1 hypothetical protein DY000_02006181 [Brassica cretica]